MRRCVVLLAGLVILIVSTSALADCYYNGQRVPSGTRIGPMMCEGNIWVYRP